MSDIEIHHLGAAYALDALDERERTAYEAHYSACEICRTDVREFRAAAAELGSLTATRPPADLKAKVMAEIATTRQMSPLPGAVVRLADHRRRRIVTAGLSVAAAVVVFLAGAVVLGGGDDGDEFGDAFAAWVVEADPELVKLEGQTAGTFTVAWSGDEAAVLADELPDPGAGKTYELWLIDDSGSHAVGMLDPAADGKIRRMVTVHGTPNAWGITIEDEAGSEVPTEPVLFVATV